MLGLNRILKWANGYDVPDDSWLERAYNKTLYTKDMWKLEQYQLQLVFIYDDMMEHHPHHSLVNEASVRLAQAFTVDRFSMFKKKLGKESFPIPLGQPFAGAPLLPIKGELYGVRPYQFIVLDEHKKNGVEFIRARMKIVVPYREVRQKRTMPGEHRDVKFMPWQTQVVKAWMYVGIPSYWLEMGPDILDAGYRFSPVRRYSPKIEGLDQYYCFTPMEYDDV